MAKQLIDKTISPDKIISSPAKRAKQTSEILAKEFKYDVNEIIFEKFIYQGYTTSELISYIQKMDDNLLSIMVVGHNPDIASFGMNLTNHSLYQFPTSAVICITFDIDSWKELEARSGQTELFIYPSQFKD